MSAIDRVEIHVFTYAVDNLGLAEQPAAGVDYDWPYIEQHRVGHFVYGAK